MKIQRDHLIWYLVRGTKTNHRLLLARQYLLKQAVHRNQLVQRKLDNLPLPLYLQFQQLKVVRQFLLYHLQIQQLKVVRQFLLHHLLYQLVIGSYNSSS